MAWTAYVVGPVYVRHYLLQDVPVPLFPGSRRMVHLRLRAREPFLANPAPVFY